jgi:broad specificity phosphatase PhoE
MVRLVPDSRAVWTFVRHGESQANAERWFAGQLDAPLTELGEQQARAVGFALAHNRFARAFASDLQRASRTAQLLLETRPVPLMLTPALQERHAGHWQGRTIEDVAASGELPLLLQWGGRPTGGESLRDVALRALRWLVTVDGDCDTLIVAHGALLRGLIGVIDRTPRDRIGLWQPGNCELITRRIQPGQWAALLDVVEREAAR